MADGRLAPGRFADPTAEPLLREDERALVERVRDESPPPGWVPRLDYEMVRGSGEVVVPRTVAIDDAVRSGPRAQVVILGAGLDGRAWRMPELAESEVFEVDQPASQRDKQDRAAGLSGAKPRYVPVDFGRDNLADALETAGHRFTVQRDDNLVSLATNLRMPIHRRSSLENSRVAVADHA